MRLLESLGYRRVAHYGGGIVGWRQAGLPLEVGEERRLAPERRELLSMHPPAP